MKKKLLVAVLCVVMMAVGGLATWAYFTDQDAVTNTFTVGDVQILLDEEDVDNDADKTDITTGENVTPARDKANKYHLLPGHTYDKDPIVHVTAASEDCFVYVTVDNQIKDIESTDVKDEYDSIATQMSKNGWVALMDGDKQVTVNNVPVYYYKDVVAKNATDKNLEVFQEFKIDGEKAVNQADAEFYIGKYKDKQIVIKAYAVQADGFDKPEANPLAAWKATFGK